MNWLDKYQDGGIVKPTEKELSDINKFIKNLNTSEPLVKGKTANTWGNMLGNVGQYFLDIKDDDLKESDYRPTKTRHKIFGEPEEKYYSRPGMREDVYKDLTSDRVKKDYNWDGTFDDIYNGLLSNGQDRTHNANNAFPKNAAGFKGQYNNGHGSFKGEFNLGRYSTDAGEDENGKYISFVDKYDWNGLKTENSINFYDRIYENQWKEFQSENKPNNIKYQDGGTIEPDNNFGSDLYTRMMNMIETFGGSAIGDAVDGISPKAADWLEKYSAGLIPHTSEEMLEANRGSGANKLKQAGDVANAISLGIATGGLAKMAAPYLSRIGKKAVKPVKETLKDLPINQPNIKPTSSDLPEYMKPYLSKYEKPISKEQEIFESFLSPERQEQRLIERTVNLDQSGDIVRQGFDRNFMTRPLTPFTRNELTPGVQLYRKIGGKKGLQDLIDKGGAQAPRPMKMNSGLILDTPFFGIGKRPNENYSGMFTVETPKPSMSKYDWSNKVGGTSNYGVAPIDKSTDNVMNNLPLEDLEVYRKKWFSNNYKKLDKSNLEAGMRGANTQNVAEKVWKWGSRAAATDQIFNDGDYTGGDWLNKFEDGGVIEDNRGQWAHPGEVTKINSNNITMQGVDYPVLGVSNTGDKKLMQPGEDYQFDGESVTEYPIMKKGGWLDKYNK